MNKTIQHIAIGALFSFTCIFAGDFSGRYGIAGNVKYSQNKQDGRDKPTYSYSANPSILHFVTAKVAIEGGVNFNGYYGEEILDQKNASIFVGGRIYPLKDINVFGAIYGQSLNTKMSHGYSDISGYGITLRLGYDWFILNPVVGIEPYAELSQFRFGDGDYFNKQSTISVGLNLLILFKKS